jgi:hypothetical protein
MNYFLLILAFLLSSCDAPEVVTLPSLFASLPAVLSVEPENGSAITSAVEIDACFSKAIDETTVSKFTFIVVEDFNSSSLKALQKELDNSKIAGLNGLYSMTEDALCAKFVPKDEFVYGKRYGIILTKGIQSADGFSFPKIYVSSFDVLKEDEVAGTINSVLDPQEPSTDEQNSLVNQDNSVAPESITLSKLVLNEIYYDAPNADTNGELFIELKGTPEASVSGYKIIFVNGDDGKITDSITLPAEASVQGSGFYVVADAVTGNADQSSVASADFITNFDPQNGPDAVQLLDNSGELIDAVCYGEVKTKTAENGLAMCENSPAPDVSGGKSISRLEDAFDTDDNKADFLINITPSPQSGEVTTEAL